MDVLRELDTELEAVSIHADESCSVAHETKNIQLPGCKITQIFQFLGRSTHAAFLARSKSL